ncbi:MAG: amino acid adenylation domain-containing protein, partial [Smithella sp.]
LINLGVGSDVLVGICMERSLEMVVGLLGILKAGGAYVPLDPAYPKERLAFMVEDTGVPVLLTQESEMESMPEYVGHVLCMDRDYKKYAQERTGVPVSGANSDNLAYVIYTSGSTGKPKGVQISHRAVVNFLCSMIKKPGISKEDILLSVTTLSFDIAALELFLPLVTGSQIVLVSREIASDGILLLRHLQECGATMMQATPATWRMLLEAGWHNKIGLKMLCGGEAMSPELASQLLDRGDSLWNMYGPTETTIWSAIYRIESKINPVPIGVPIANTQIYILDRNLQPVPIGIAGELYIGGDGLARGYLNRPELTMERFLSDPFADRKEARMYRTGDLACYLSDGNIKYLNRIDHQVKIRGFRIELGEIEAVLKDHGAVSRVVVMDREDVSGDKRLVAYIIPDNEHTPDTNDLREHLRKNLPEYMIPAAFVMMEKFPLTPNGKIDRRAFPMPEYARSDLEETYVAPRTAIEQSLAEIWAEVLGVKRVGINDNFFQLGGHSLLAVRLFVRIRKWIGVDLPLVTLFKSPTVRGLAEILDPKGSTVLVSGDSMPEVVVPVQQWRSLVTIRPEGSRPPLFLVHAVGGNLLYYHSLLRHLGPDQPVYGLQAKGIDGVMPPHSSMKEMAGYYLAEIRTVQPSGPYFLGGASFGGTCAFEIAQQLIRQGEKVAFLALLDSIGPGAGGYHAWRTSLKRRIFHALDDDVTQKTFLPVYFMKRLYLYLSNSMRRLCCDFFRLVKHPIPLELRDWDLYRNHNKAINNYVPHQYPGSITLFRGPEGNEWPYNDPELGWKDLVKGELKVIIIPAGHYEFVESAELGAQFAENLKEAQDNMKKQGPFNDVIQEEAKNVNKGETADMEWSK